MRTKNILAGNNILNFRDVCQEDISLPANPKLVHHVFQQHKIQNNELYIYSVFYDDREFLHGKNVLRALIISTPIKSNVYCQIWKEDSSDPILTVAKVVKSGSGHILGGRQYDQLLVTCSLGSGTTRPTNLSLIWLNPCIQPTNNIKIQYPEKKDFNESKHEFGICVPVTFWYVDPYRIMEWVEMHKLFGVTEINVCYVHLSNITMATLEYYQNEGIVKLFNLPSVPLYEHNRNGVKIGSPIGLNDCMLKNMYSYKWVLVIDFDEIILPRNESKLTNYSHLVSRIEEDMLKSVRIMYPISYAFRNSYFWIGCNNSDPTISNTYFFKYFQREKASNFLYTTKSFTNPRFCLSLFNHYCYTPYLMSQMNKIRLGPKSWIHDVPQSLGLLHHYRVIDGGKRLEKCRLNNTGRKMILDTTTKMYKRRISPQVEKTTRYLKLS